MPAAALSKAGLAKAHAGGDDLRAGLAHDLAEQLAGVDRAGGNHLPIAHFHLGDVREHAGLQVDGGHGCQLPAAGGGREEDHFRLALGGQLAEQAGVRLGAVVLEGGVVGQQHLAGAVTEGRFGARFNILPEEQRGNAAAHHLGQLTAGADHFPRNAKGLAIKLVDINPNLVAHHSTFSARILSASFSAISWENHR